MTKKDLLLKWCKFKGVFSGVDIRKWGIDNYYISADRVIRKLAEEGSIQKINNFEAKLMGLIKDRNAKIAWYKA